jgi:hypothetical protein
MVFHLRSYRHIGIHYTRRPGHASARTEDPETGELSIEQATPRAKAIGSVIYSEEKDPLDTN